MPTAAASSARAQGAATVKRLLPNAVFVFLTAESERALVERLVARKTETPEKLVVRAATAREEAARLGEFDYVVVNAQGKLEQAVRAGAGRARLALLCGKSPAWRGVVCVRATEAFALRGGPQVRDLGAIIDAEKLRVDRKPPSL